LSCFFGMKKEFRVKKHSEFDRIIHAGRKIKTSRYTIYLEPSPSQSHARIGIAVSKKNGNAVTRVRIKRQVRAMVSRHFDLTHRLNIVVVIHSNFSPLEGKNNEEELAKALEQIKGNAIE
jgi:ribonuclease P protein component